MNVSMYESNESMYEYVRQSERDKKRSMSMKSFKPLWKNYYWTTREKTVGINSVDIGFE